MRALFVILILLFFHLSTFAQSATVDHTQIIPTSVSETEAPTNTTINSKYNHIFSINFIPLLGILTLNNSVGLGLGYQYVLNSHYSIGGNLFYKKQAFTRNYPNVVTFQNINAGIEVRYKISSFLEDGIYGGIGLAQSGVHGEVETKSAFGGDILNEKIGSSYFWNTLFVPRLGYLWVPSSKRGYGDLSLSYDSVNLADYSYERGTENSQSTSMEIRKKPVGPNLTFLVGFVF